MVNRIWIVNASPLILLGKAGYLHLIVNLVDSVVIPSAVIKEISVKDDGVALLEELNNDVRFRIDDDEPIPSELLAWDLGRGETQVIALAMRYNADRVVLDDIQARRCAKAMGLAIIGTIGLVGRAKQEGIIDHAGPIFDLLRQTGLYISDDILAMVLREVGE